VPHFAGRREKRGENTTIELKNGPVWKIRWNLLQYSVSEGMEMESTRSRLLSILLSLSLVAMKRSAWYCNDWAIKTGVALRKT